MKHLKKYRIFESNIQEDIQDLLIELEDVNFVYERHWKIIQVMKHDKSLFFVKDIKDFILRIIDMLNSDVEIFITDIDFEFYEIDVKTNNEELYYKWVTDIDKREYSTNWQLGPIRKMTIHSK